MEEDIKVIWEDIDWEALGNIFETFRDVVLPIFEPLLDVFTGLVDTIMDTFNVDFMLEHPECLPIELRVRLWWWQFKYWRGD